jgi:hypothetical protein
VSRPESGDNQIKKNKIRIPHQRSLAEFLNWMPSTESQDDGAAEDIQESAEAALAATSQGI